MLLTKIATILLRKLTCGCERIREKKVGWGRREQNLKSIISLEGCIGVLFIILYHFKIFQNKVNTNLSNQQNMKHCLTILFQHICLQ